MKYKVTFRYTLNVITIAMTILCLLLTQLEATKAQVSESVRVADLPADAAVEWMQTLYNQVAFEAVSAPAASRIYAYSSVTLWEALLPGMPGKNSMAGQLNGMPDMPYLEEDAGIHDWLTTANAALRMVNSELLEKPESKKAFDNLYNKQLKERQAVVGKDVIKRSVEYGEAVGKAIIEWIAEDNYSSVHGKAYELPSEGDWSYVLTTAGTKPAEPYWGELRSFAMEYNGVCNVQPNVDFSTEKDSTFYSQAMEVKNVGDKLTLEQKAIADFWLDTPGVTGSPSGHWMMIGNQLVDQFKLNLERAAGMYVMIGVAVGDSFISCWGLKYEVLLLRPETYIQKNIRRSWKPYIQTPPFPEYPSGHSVASAAVAEVLTDYFGAMAFTDDTHKARKFPPRFFTSFEAAASEAAISRLYGGIHYRSAIENGMRQGRCIGRNIINRVQLQPQGNG